MESEGEYCRYNVSECKYCLSLKLDQGTSSTVSHIGELNKQKPDDFYSTHYTGCPKILYPLVHDFISPNGNGLRN